MFVVISGIIFASPSPRADVELHHVRCQRLQFSFLFMFIPLSDKISNIFNVQQYIFTLNASLCLQMFRLLQGQPISEIDNNTVLFVYGFFLRSRKALFFTQFHDKMFHFRNIFQPAVKRLRTVARTRPSVRKSARTRARPRTVVVARKRPNVRPHASARTAPVIPANVVGVRYKGYGK